MRHDLTTEAQNPASTAIDALRTEQMLEIINAADAEIAGAVRREIPIIAAAVDGITERLEKGGRLFYIGAGTSGRLGVLDASECPPTFNVPPEMVQGLIAGGDEALRRSAEKAEDDPERGKRDLEERGFGSGDALVGIAASGRTPYVLGGLRYARGLGALTIGLSCTANSEVAQTAEIAITPIPGPEVITGSTRMRAGTATKMVLNMLSTGVMIRMGYVYGNLMVNVQPTNDKLTDRARRIISAITGVSYDEASRLLAKAGSVRTAVIMYEQKASPEEAEAILVAAKGRLRVALGQ
ncbi:MAG: N-acetylmuramic acid 6-phosphate etherase [Acidobacteriaceae bacterium]|nr:N-acetylmuramic acid 6-phosphate etherase [Acidobacteriaceae bacterium]MBV9304774.1 N-acetylmuramic acid 6-phosphate etherase [Acidobacteriaceae bacterium]MBV9676057.1 N-acetylmuramic acid 6-phosphate etherase [Acidobacteriaceae bacterium]MBV9939826.1 N-acetylmuramic acid 6-phosphate etherase [Acidobacteriaceae bacterium]